MPNRSGSKRGRTVSSRNNDPFFSVISDDFYDYDVDHDVMYLDDFDFDYDYDGYRYGYGDVDNYFDYNNVKDNNVEDYTNSFFYDYNILTPFYPWPQFVIEGQVPDGKKYELSPFDVSVMEEISKSSSMKTKAQIGGLFCPSMNSQPCNFQSNDVEGFMDSKSFYDKCGIFEVRKTDNVEHSLSWDTQMLGMAANMNCMLWHTRTKLNDPVYSFVNYFLPPTSVDYHLCWTALKMNPERAYVDLLVVERLALWRIHMSRSSLSGVGESDVNAEIVELSKLERELMSTKIGVSFLVEKYNAKSKVFSLEVHTFDHP